MTTIRLLRAALLTMLLPVSLAFGQASEEAEREGGIIGTGIVGTITALGSIMVNGQRIGFPPDLAITDGVTIKRAAKLEPGLTVAAWVEPGETDWQAVAIQEVLPVVGPVEMAAPGVIVVMGTRVSMGALGANPAPGDWVAVHGLWKDREIVASRVTLLPPATGPARLSGTYLGPDADGGVSIGGTRVLGMAPKHLEPGDYVRVTGAAAEGAIVAEQLEVGHFQFRPGLIQVEGHLSRPTADGRYTLLGSGLVAYTDNPAMIDSERRVVACGRDGVLGLTDSDRRANALIEMVSQRLGC